MFQFVQASCNNSFSAIPCSSPGFLSDTTVEFLVIKIFQPLHTIYKATPVEFFLVLQSALISMLGNMTNHLPAVALLEQHAEAIDKSRKRKAEEHLSNTINLISFLLSWLFSTIVLTYLLFLKHVLHVAMFLLLLNSAH